MTSKASSSWNWLNKIMSEINTETHFAQPKITGYRQLSTEEVMLMNEGKQLAEQVGQFITKLQGFKNDELVIDQRWIALGKTQLQQGFMAVIRGIAQPTTF